MGLSKVKVWNSPFSPHTSTFSVNHW
jgi:hypothetical protein